MRRRLFGLLPCAVLAVVLLLPATAAAAPAPQPVLAVEVEEGGEAPGPDPAPPDATDNPAAPTDYEANFLWGAAVGLLVLMVLGAVALGGMYYLMVARPRRTETADR